jgi:hypothetical protein
LLGGHLRDEREVDRHWGLFGLNEQSGHGRYLLRG